MARPLRIEFAGALYHATARGNAQAEIYRDDVDRRAFLSLLDRVVRRHDWYCHAYCLMGNHYHLLVETASPTLSKGMKHLNGSYTQSFNRRHRRVGHVFQGRFKAILVQKDAYLLELARYIVLNPVRARMVRHAEDWPWSSYRATVGLCEPEDCLTTDWVLAGFGERRGLARRPYREFVSQGPGQPSPWERLRNQIYLGDETFVEAMQCKLDPEQSLTGVPRKQKQGPAKSLDYYAQRYARRDEAMAMAYLGGHYTLVQVGAHFGVSYATVSRAVKKLERSGL